ncbi:MAG: hypothetical protein JJT77_05670 [Crocinitomicaceae bacterium]|nr:hypothetical protein [Crocinitomicaceae bacterium]
MYHINTAVIKSILANMPKEEFLEEFQKIRERYLNTHERSVEHVKYASLYNWCLRLYRSKLTAPEQQKFIKKLA